MLKKVNRSLLDELSTQAKNSERKRAHHNFHESLEETTHRLLIASEPATYIRPHRHLADSKWELFFILRGRVVVLIFDGGGKVLDRVELAADADCRAIEMSPDTWHTFASLEEGSVVMEVKPGPYCRPGVEDSAAWAPAEGAEDCAKFLNLYKTAQAGDVLA